MLQFPALVPDSHPELSFEAAPELAANLQPHPTRGKTLHPEVLTAAEVCQVLRASDHPRCGLRNRALMAFVWRTGLRVSEALRVHVHDLDAVENTVAVRRGKGGGTTHRRPAQPLTASSTWASGLHSERARSRTPRRPRCFARSVARSSTRAICGTYCRRRGA